MASNKSFKLSVSSKDAVIEILSDGKKQCDVVSIPETGPEFDTLIYNGTMQEVQKFDETLGDSKSLDYLFKCAKSNKTHNLTMEENTLVDTEYEAGYTTGSSNSVITNNVPATNNDIIGKPILSKCGTENSTLMVSPTVNFPYLKARKWQTTPTSVISRSISTLIIPSQGVLDRLTRISGNSPHKSAPHSPHHSYGSSLEINHLQPWSSILQKQEQQKLQLLKENMELMSYKRINEDLQNKIKTLSEEKEMFLHREIKLQEQIKKKAISNKQMAIVLEEYVKIISSQIDEDQEDKLHYNNKLNMLIAERDESLKHLATTECFLNNILNKYETCDCLIYYLKDREKALHQSFLDYEEGMKKYKFIYNKLKAISSESLNEAKKSLDNIKKNHSIQIAKLNATIKKSEVTIFSLQEMLTLKIKDYEKLSKIYGQLTYEAH